MAEYDNNMTGALFKNDRKENDKHPDYRGNCEIDGKKLFVSGWLRKSRAGETFMSLRFTKPERPQRATPAPKAVADLDDEIPF